MFSSDFHVESRLHFVHFVSFVVEELRLFSQSKKSPSTGDEAEAKRLAGMRPAR